MSDIKRVAILSSAGGGGAGIAARRFADALNASGGPSGMAKADFIDIASIGQPVPDTVSPMRNFSNHTISDTHFTVEYPGYQRGWLVDMLSGYDLVKINWASFLTSLAELHALARTGTRMLFMMHDFYYITGGCHYPATCTQLARGCSNCPQVDRTLCSPDVIANNRAVKSGIFSYENVHLAAPSRFLRDEAVRSGIIPTARAHVLRNPYMPVADAQSQDAPVNRILLIADSLTEGRKNMPFALELLASLRARCTGKPNFTVDVIGAASPEMAAYLTATNVPHVLHGRITDHRAMVAIMRQTDILLTCSLEDNWPNILVEAGAYGGKPVVGPGHGCEEFVRHYNYGTIAKDYSIEAFLKALTDAMTDFSIEKRTRFVDDIRRDHAPQVVLRTLMAIAEAMPGQPGEKPQSGQPAPQSLGIHV